MEYDDVHHRHTHVTSKVKVKIKVITYVTGEINYNILQQFYSISFVQVYFCYVCQRPARVWLTGITRVPAGSRPCNAGMPRPAFCMDLNQISQANFGREIIRYVSMLQIIQHHHTSEGITNKTS